MQRLFVLGGLLAVSLATMGGCAQDSLKQHSQFEKYQQQQLAQARQQEQLLGRSSALDKDNQELGSLLAQSKRRAQALEDQLVALRDQLSGATAQLVRAREEKKTTEQKVQALTASLQRRGGVTIKPNNSYQRALPVINLPGVHVRRDEDLIRVELPADQLFVPGTGRLQANAVPLVSSVAAELLRTNPGQHIGVEGHTDNTPLATGTWQNSHQLSIAQAMAVYDILVRQGRTSPGQLSVAGFGANQPVVSNATPVGRQRNRRVELVVYPKPFQR